MPADEMIQDLLVYFGPLAVFGLFFASAALVGRRRRRLAEAAAEAETEQP